MAGISTASDTVGLAKAAANALLMSPAAICKNAVSADAAPAIDGKGINELVSMDGMMKAMPKE
mgnify:CR=1 FL=1